MPQRRAGEASARPGTWRGFGVHGVHVQPGFGGAGIFLRVGGLGESRIYAIEDSSWSRRRRHGALGLMWHMV